MLALASTGCSSGSRPTLEVEAAVTACPRTGGPCVTLPAAGASYVVLGGEGETVARGTLSPAGRAVVPATEGVYEVQVRVPELDLRGSSGRVRKGPGDNAVLAVEVVLPTVVVAPAREPGPSGGG